MAKLQNWFSKKIVLAYRIDWRRQAGAGGAAGRRRPEGGLLLGNPSPSLMTAVLQGQQLRLEQPVLVLALEQGLLTDGEVLLDQGVGRAQSLHPGLQVGHAGPATSSVQGLFFGAKNPSIKRHSSDFEVWSFLQWEI